MTIFRISIPWPITDILIENLAEFCVSFDKLSKETIVQRSNSDKRYGRILLFAITAIGVLGAGGAFVSAQDGQRAYKPGDSIETGGGYVYKILRCDGLGEWDECEYQAYLDGKPTGSSTGRMTIRNLRSADQRVRDSKTPGFQRSSNEPTTRNNVTAPVKSSDPQTKTAISPKRVQGANAGPVAGSDGGWKVGDRLEVNDRAFWYPAQIVAVKGGRYKVHFDGYPSSDDQWVDRPRMRPVGGHKVAEVCSFEPPGPAVTGRTRFSEALAKRKIYDEYNWKANGTLSAPLKVGVVFLSVQMGSTYRNTVGNVPGYGAQRRHGGAPAGAPIHPLKTKIMVCEQYRDGVTRRLVEGSRACFIDKDGSWTCSSENDTKIIQLDQD